MQSQAIRITNVTHPTEDWQTAVKSFRNYNQSKALSPNTIDYYDYRLSAFLSFLQSAGIDSTPASCEVRTIREFLISEAAKSPTTSQHSFCALRALYAYLVRDGFMDRSPMESVDKPKRLRCVIQTFNSTELEAVLGTCKNDFAGVRDRAIITLLLDSGLRVSELCGIELTDIDWGEQTVVVLGKGNKERIVPFGSVARQALSLYLGRRGDDLTSRGFFVNCYGEPVNRHTVHKMIVRRCAEAGVEGVRCSPHTFRHTFAVSFLRNGGGVFELQKMLGHTSLDQTRKYAELSNTDVLISHRQNSPADRLQVAKPQNGRKRLR